MEGSGEEKANGEKAKKGKDVKEVKKEKENRGSGAYVCPCCDTNTEDFVLCSDCGLRLICSDCDEEDIVCTECTDALQSAPSYEVCLGDLHIWNHNGRMYLRSEENECWLTNYEFTEIKWAGIYVQSADVFIKN